MRRFLLVLLTVALVAGAALPPAASGAFPPVGLRAGFTSWEEYSQFHFGAHMKAGDLFPNVQLVPSLEMGFGDGLTLVTLNGDFSYRFTELVSYPWALYAGGSLSLNYINPDDLESDLHLGLSALAGLGKSFANGDEIMVELRFGILDSPGFKATLGYTFF